MNTSIIGTWYIPHLLKDDFRVEYIKFSDNNDYIYNDGLGRFESTYTLKSDSMIALKSPNSEKEIMYHFEIHQIQGNTILKLSLPTKGIIFTLVGSS